VPTNPRVQIRHLEFRYPGSDFQLRVPDLSIAAGERVALIGSSGCGKTTLAHLAVGIQVPDKGEILVDETPVHQLNDTQRRALRAARIGFIFQEFELLDYLRVEENILLPYLINAELRLDQTAKTRAKDLATSLGIADKLKRKPTELSQGEKQRVAICRALVNQPGLVIADEPTGNLDQENTALVMDMIETHVAAHQATLIMITHDRSLLPRFDREIDVAAL
jgi:putative ABC transport system ATP-binding protein